MQNEIQKTGSQQRQQNYWSNSDQQRLVQALTILINGQKTYGKDYSIKDTLAYYRMKLDGRFPMGSVLKAINEYTDRQNDIPAPADIIKILSPEKPRITEAQFVEAQKWQERNGWPMFSSADMTIREYKAQQNEEQDEYKTAQIENQKVAEVVADTVKRIGA